MNGKNNHLSEQNLIKKGRIKKFNDFNELVDIIQFTEQVTMKIYGQLDESIIFKKVINEFTKSNQYSASIVLLMDNDNKLSVAGSSLSNLKIKNGEKLTGLKLKKYKIDLDKSKIYKSVIQDGKTINTPVGEIISELFPRQLANVITKIMGYKYRSTIITPLKKYNKIIGAFAMTSTKQAEYIIPSVKNLACHISVALELADKHVECRKAEEKILRTRQFLQNIINSASECIISFDKEYNITTWNNTAENITGYKAHEIVGKSLNMLSVFNDSQDLLNILQDINNKIPKRINDLILKTKHGTNKYIKPSYSIIKSEKGESLGILLCGKDITHEKEKHKELSKGNSYLIFDKDNKNTIDMINELNRLGYKGLIITRTNPDILKSLLHLEDIKILLLNQEYIDGFEQIGTLDGLITKIKDFSSKYKNTVIFLDRIDFLITYFSFELFTKALYKITNIISENKSLLLLLLHPKLLDNRQKTIIEQELQMLPSQNLDDILINDASYDILRYINKQNNHNKLVSFKKISKEFSIDKSTAARRIKILEDNKLVTVKKQGRIKTVHISKKGNALLNN